MIDNRTYANGTSQNLFQASTIDAFGRVRQAQYGQTSYAATYADLGRRLMSQVSVTSSHGSHSISFQTLDPVGRERGRTEVKHDDITNGITISNGYTYTYDALGRLSSALKTTGASTTLNQQFNYDPLGNVLSLVNVGVPAATTTMTYAATDRDRICRIAFGTSTGTACNVAYDELGSITSQPTPTGSRQYGYLIDGSVRTISNDAGSSAHFRYDAFGGVQQLDITSTGSLDIRQDRHYGSLLTSHLEGTSCRYRPSSTVIET